MSVKPLISVEYRSHARGNQQLVLKWSQDVFVMLEYENHGAPYLKVLKRCSQDSWKLIQCFGVYDLQDRGSAFVGFDGEVQELTIYLRTHPKIHGTEVRHRLRLKDPEDHEAQEKIRNLFSFLAKFWPVYSPLNLYNQVSLHGIGVQDEVTTVPGKAISLYDASKEVNDIAFHVEDADIDRWLEAFQENPTFQGTHNLIPNLFNLHHSQISVEELTNSFHSMMTMTTLFSRLMMI
jgi:hypothetical protein